MLRPYRVIFETATPVVLAENPPTFDGIVYAAISQFMVGCTHEDKITKMKEILSFDEEAQVFRASSVYFGINAEQGLVAKTIAHVDVIEPKLKSHLFLPNGRGGKYVSVMTAGGATKTRMNKRLAYDSPCVMFDFVGDANEISSLLSKAFVGVGYNGYQGQGQILSQRYYPKSEDLSLHDGNKPTRPLPQAYCENHNLSGMAAICTTLPPYYSKDTLQSVQMPERIRIEQV